MSIHLHSIIGTTTLVIMLSVFMCKIVLANTLTTPRAAAVSAGSDYCAYYPTSETRCYNNNADNVAGITDGTQQAACAITVTSAVPTACNPPTNTYNLAVSVTYSGQPTGNININIGGTNYPFSPDGTSPDTYTITGLMPNGAFGVNVSATFVSDPTCTHTLTYAYNAPTSCVNSCSCKDYIYLGDPTGNDVRKYEIPSSPGSTTMTEIGNPWLADTIKNPHGAVHDLNGFLYVSSITDSITYKLTCDGTIVDTLMKDAFYNGFSVGNTMYVTQTIFQGQPVQNVAAFDLCTGDKIGNIILNTGGLAWGMQQGADGCMYIGRRWSNTSQHAVYKICDWTNQDFIDSTSYDAFITPATILATIAPAMGDTALLKLLGVTADEAGNIYVVLNGAQNKTCIQKYNNLGVFVDQKCDYLLSDLSSRLYGARGIVYKDGFLFLSSPNKRVIVMDTTLEEYLNAGVLEAGGAKAIGLVTECCPNPQNQVINKTICSQGNGEKVFLQDIFNCGVGIICEGQWAETSNTSNGGITMNTCDLSVTVNGSGCATYTLAKTTAATETQQCGPFSITINICTEVPSVTVVAQQGTCSGATPNNNATINITNAVHTNQAGISAGTTYTGPSFNGAGTINIASGSGSFTGLTHNTSYTVRLFNNDNTCYKDTLIVTPTINCVVCNLTASTTGNETNVSCNGGNDGAVGVTASGNLGAVTYLWSNNATTAAISNLVAGTYSVTVTESATCTAVAAYTVTQPTVLDALCSHTNVTINGGSNGTASVVATGGTTPYTYLWSNGETSASITGLTADTYSVTIADFNGCTANCAETITQPNAPDLSLTKAVNTTTTALNGTVIFTLTLTNDNSIDATGVEVTDTLPAGTTFVSSSDPSNVNVIGNVLTWNVGNMLGTDAPKTLQITITATEEGSFLNIAEITAMNEPDADSTPNNNTPGEDDQDQACFSVPVKLCSDSNSASITITSAAASSWQWYVSTDGSTYTALSSETNQDLVIDNTLMGGNGVTKYFKVAYNGAAITDGCGATMCCPVIVTTEICIVCPPPKCIPIIITKH